MALIEKIDRSIKLLKSIKSDEIELSYAGGKDSDVILELAKMADIRYRAIYKKTTIDPAGTIKPVSYTHLDVYKRQPITERKNRASFRITTINLNLPCISIGNGRKIWK